MGGEERKVNEYWGKEGEGVGSEWRRDGGK